MSVAHEIVVVADSDIRDVGIDSIFDVGFIDNSRECVTIVSNIDNIERSGSTSTKSLFGKDHLSFSGVKFVQDINVIKESGIFFTFTGLSCRTIDLGGVTSIPVGAEEALGSTSLFIVADQALLLTTEVGAHRALVGTSIVGADLALLVTTLIFVGAYSALEGASVVHADSAHGATSSDGESTSTVGAHSALSVTSVGTELALSLTGGLIGFGGFEDGVVTSESHTFFGNFESTNDGVDDLLGGGGLDTEDLHVTVGTILGEGDEVGLGNGFSAHLGERGVTLVDGGLDNITIDGGEESVGNVRFLGGLVGDESESENGTAESSGEDSGSNEHLFGTVERSSESLDAKLKLSESRATSGFEFHF